MTQDETKVCNVCLIEKSLSDFYFRKETGRYRDNCKKCKPLRKLADIRNEVATRTTKVCKHCGEEKPLSEYNKITSGYPQPYCKPCDSKRKKKHHEANRDKILERNKVRYEENKNEILAKMRIYKKNNPQIQKEYRNRNKDKKRECDKRYADKNKEKLLAKKREYYEKNKARISEYYKIKRKDPEYKAKKSLADKIYREKNSEKVKAVKKIYYDRVGLEKAKESQSKKRGDKNHVAKKRLRGRIYVALKRGIKSASTVDLLGCDIDFFIRYFQSLFTDNMNWDLFLNGGIHIDHIKPCKLFDLSDPKQQKECFHYTNLQPLHSLDNLKKGAKYEYGGTQR